MGKYHLTVSCLRFLDEAESPEIASYRFKNTKVGQISKDNLRKVQCSLRYFETLLEGTLSNLSTGTTAGESDIIVSRWAK